MASADSLYTTNLTVPAVIGAALIEGAIYPVGVHAGTYDVLVRTLTGGNNSTSTQKITITTATAVTVTGLSPASGNNYFETSTLSITGSGFFGGTGTDDVRTIKLSSAGTPTIAKGTVASDLSIINCVVPAGIDVGTYDVLVTTGFAATATSAVKYVVTSLPVVTNLSSTTGLNTVQATGITIKGSHFTGITSMFLSGPQNVYVGTYTPMNDTELQGVMIPDGILAGTYDVKITVPLGTNLTSSAKWIATAAKPVVFGILPGSGSNSASTTVTISGTGFYGGTNTTPNILNVRMYSSDMDTLLASYTVTSNSLLQAVVPPGFLAGTFDVKVTNGGGECTNSVKFSITTPAPAVTGVVPSSGLRETPSTVSVLGTGFFGGTSSNKVLEVKIGSTVLTSSGAFDDNTIPLIIPSNLDTGRYPIIVTTSGGISTIVSNFDVLFNNTVSYGFAASGINLTIPANTFGSSTALIVSTTPADAVKAALANTLKTKNIKTRSDLASTVREISSSTGVTIASGMSLGIRFSYASANINDSVVENALRVAFLNTTTGLWEFVTGTQTVDLAAKEVICSLTHLSTFRVVQYVLPANTLAGAVVYPNPVSFDLAAGGLLKFVNLTENPTLRIFTVSGEPVKTIVPNGTGNAGNDGKIEWDGKNESGEIVTRGLYIYLVTDEAGGRKAGKLVVK